MKRRKSSVFFNVIILAMCLLIGFFAGNIFSISSGDKIKDISISGGKEL